MKLALLNAIRTFEVAARQRSFKKAAEELFVTPAAVSYQIKQLEQQLGMPLFERGHRKVVLTPAAQRCLPLLTEGFDQIALAMEQLQASAQPRNFVVSAGPAFTVKWLAPQMHQFAAEHADVSISIMAGLGLANFRHDQVDAAIRVGQFDSSGLFVVKLASETLVPMCHPRWLEQHGPISDPAELFNFPMIHDDSMLMIRQTSGWKTLAETLGIDVARAEKGLRFNQSDHALQAAIDGAGVLLGRRVLAQPDILAGRLQCLFTELEMATEVDYHFVCLQEKAELYEIETFLQWLNTLLQDSLPD